MRRLFVLMAVLMVSLASIGQGKKSIIINERIGHGADSVLALESYNLFKKYDEKYLYEGNDIQYYKKALDPMQYIIDKHPFASNWVYRKGTTMLEEIIKVETDSVEKQKYYSILMELIDKRIEYLDTLNSISSDKFHTTRGDLICQKAYDYCNATGRRDTVAYKMFKDGIALMGLDAEPIIFTEYVQCIINMYNDNLSNPNIADIRKQVIEDLLETNDICEKLTAKAKAYPSIEIPADTTSSDTSKWEVQYELNDTARYIISCCDNVAYYTNYYLPLMADSTTLVNNLYTVDKIEANKDSIAYLKTAVNILGQNKCENTENYLLASDYLYALNKTPQAAIGKANRCLKENDINGAIQYFDEAISLESDKQKKIKYTFIVAQLFYKKKNVGQCRNYCRKVLQLDPTHGQSYLLQAYCIAMSAHGDYLQKSYYYCLATDYCNKAKKVDPSCVIEANKKIAMYAAYYYPKSEAFFAGIKAGDVVSVAGETTTLRLR